MFKAKHELRAAVVATAVVLGCQGEEQPPQAGGLGVLQVALTQAPADVTCLRVNVEGYRTVVHTQSVVPGQSTVFRLPGLPTGSALVSAAAYSVPCAALAPTIHPPWTTDAPIAVRIDVVEIAHVAVKLVRNGRLSIAVDFETPRPGPTLPPPPVGATCGVGGTVSSQSPYLTALAPGVVTRAILTVGDSPNLKPDGTPYRLVGIPDGMGAFDNGDGTFTLLVNHELGATVGVTRAHGARGAFVSRWTIRKCDLSVLDGRDLIQQVTTWNPATATYNAPTTGVALGRLCSADLPATSAFHDAGSGLGYDGRLFTNGEEVGADGRAFAHAMDGNSYELPRLGRVSFENVVAHPRAGLRTVVVGLDDSGGGQVYVYAGRKTGTGSPVERAGLTNGALFGLKVTGAPVEDPAAGIPSGTAFTLVSLGNVEGMSGAALETASNTGLVTKFQRPEDGHWDPNSPDDFYFVTTASFTGSSRLWRLRFVDATRPELGGRIDMVLTGSEGQKMMDNVTLDRRGRLYAQEDPGAQDHLAKIWRFDLASSALVAIAEHDPARFNPAVAAPLLTRDEESSGIIDASDILGEGWFLVNVQAHAGHADAELVEHGQLLAIYDPLP